VAPEGRKVGSLKRRVRSQLARWEMKNCTPLWREAHFQVKMCKAHQLRSTFSSCDVDAVVARSKFRSQTCLKLTVSDHFWKLRSRKVHAIVARSTFPSENAQDTPSTFGSWHVEKCTPLWREAHSEVKMLKTPDVRTTFGRSNVVLHGRRKGF